MGDLARSDEDVLAYILYPATMTKFLQTKYGIEPPKEAGAEKPIKKVLPLKKATDKTPFLKRY